MGTTKAMSVTKNYFIFYPAVGDRDIIKSGASLRQHTTECVGKSRENKQWTDCLVNSLVNQGRKKENEETQELSFEHAKELQNTRSNRII